MSAHSRKRKRSDVEQLCIDEFMGRGKKLSDVEKDTLLLTAMLAALDSGILDHDDDVVLVALLAVRLGFFDHDESARLELFLRLDEYINNQEEMRVMREGKKKRKDMVILLYKKKL